MGVREGLRTLDPIILQRATRYDLCVAKKTHSNQFWELGMSVIRSKLTEQEANWLVVCVFSLCPVHGRFYTQGNQSFSYDGASVYIRRNLCCFSCNSSTKGDVNLTLDHACWLVARLSCYVIQSEGETQHSITMAIIAFLTSCAHVFAHNLSCRQDINKL